MAVRRIAIILIAAAALMALGCQRNLPSPEMYKKTGSIMYTYVTITVVDTDPEHADAAIAAAFSEIRSLESLLSFWRDDSEIARINHEAGKAPVHVSPATLEMVEAAEFISNTTGGAFDCTIGPVIRLWDFKKPALPGPEALKRAIGRVDYRAVNVDHDKSTVYLADPEMSFDTGGIAKGYAADVASKRLRAMGIRAAIVSVAGDIRAYGMRPDGKPWRIGIRDPRGGSDDIIATVDIEDGAVSTSGDYERYFELDGRRYHHLLDPRTGYPAMGSISATVFTDRAVLTDGFATGAFVMGPERAIRALESAGIDAMIISPDNRSHMTRGMKARITWEKDTYPPAE